MKYILSVTGDCNDGDYMTKNTDVKVGASVEDIKIVKKIISKLIGIEEELSEYDSWYDNEVVLKYITYEELFIIEKTLYWYSEDKKITEESSEDEVTDYISEVFYCFPIEWQSGSPIHTLKNVRIFKEII